MSLHVGTVGASQAPKPKMDISMLGSGHSVTGGLGSRLCKNRKVSECYSPFQYSLLSPIRVCAGEYDKEMNEVMFSPPV